ncbi:MAG: hypothetical protein AB7K08_11140 [Microbacteriaceae bacterium]
MTTTPIPTGPTGPAGAAGPSKLLIALIAVGSVLVLVIVALVFFIIGQGNAGNSGNDNAGAPTPQTSQTPATPVAEPTDEPADGGSGDSDGSGTDDSLRFTSFTANLQVACDSNADEKAQPQISWVAANATAVYWTPSNQDATADNGYQVGTSGNQNDMSASKGPGERYEFPCNHRQTFDTTITIYGSNGQKVSKHVTFTDINWGTSSGGDED